MTDPLYYLADDLAYIEDVLYSSASYCFSEDLQERMDSLGLSAAALARRCLVSHTIVDRWRTGKARPNGKERFKELGMALGMDTEALNEFLLKNGYPGLYLKNPLDSAARLLLLQSSGVEDIVDLYRGLVKRLKLERLSTLNDETPFETAVMSRELQMAAENGKVSTWFEKFRRQFAGGGKTEKPDFRLARFLLLYLGDSNVHELVITGELPTALKNLLYPVLAGKTVTVRGLRDKLIAFGLYADMTEEEIDVMLRYARVLPFSEPSSSMDLAVLEAVRCAHGRCVLYELENLQRLLKLLDPPQDEYEELMLEQYRQRIGPVEQMASYYDSHPKTPEDVAFEEHYTSYADRGLMDYVHDVLVLLKEKGILDTTEKDSFLELICRNERGDTVWN